MRLILTSLALGLFLAGPVLGQQNDAAPTNAAGAEGPTNAPGDDCPGCSAGDAPLNSVDGAPVDDEQQEDLSHGVGNKLNQQQCVSLARYLQQTQTSVEVQQSLKARGCL